MSNQDNPISFSKWPASLWHDFRVVRNENCESCSSYWWDVVCSVSAGHFTLAQVETEEVGLLICDALKRLKEQTSVGLPIGEVITYPEDDGEHGDAG